MTLTETTLEKFEASKGRVRQLMSELRRELRNQTESVPDEIVNHPSAILVWRFEDAPEVFQKLSNSGGDEDWIAFQPADNFEYLDWAQDGTPFGRCDVQQHRLYGGTVYIGAHA